MSALKIGLLAAMDEEIEPLKNDMQIFSKKSIAGRTYYTGVLYETKTILAQSKIGKASACITASILLNKFEVDVVILIGIAGAISPELKIGDIVIGDKYLQYDMDSTPILKRHEIPYLGRTYIFSDNSLVKKAVRSSESFVTNIKKKIKNKILSEFNIENPKVYIGTISSRDQLVNSLNEKAQMLKIAPDILCVEMESAPIAQVCYEFKVPFIAIKIISDQADGHAPDEFMRFTQSVFNNYSKEIITNLYNTL
jgi:adenosylhomocysteine nucleosidase